MPRAIGIKTGKLRLGFSNLRQPIALTKPELQRNVLLSNPQSNKLLDFGFRLSGLPMFGLQFEHDRQFTTLPAMHALTMEHGVDFNQICQELSVEPLSSFLARMRYDSDSEDGEPEWYSANLGHTTFFAMFAFFSSHLDRIPTEIKSEPPMSREEFLEELQQCVTILGNRRHERFHTIVILYVPEGIEI